MVLIEPFEVEQWMDTYETTPGVLNIAETCAASVSIADLVALADTEAKRTAAAAAAAAAAAGGQPSASAPTAADPLAALATTKLTYGAIRGSATLRQVAALIDGGGREEERDDDDDVVPLPPDNVVITQGAIAANHLLFYALLGAGDHVVCVYPTYQQLYSVPKSLGAAVTLWTLKADNGYVPDPAELEAMVQPNTKMIIINNPNNPLGVPIPRPVLERIVGFARSRDLLLVSDEVYLPLHHGGGGGDRSRETIDDLLPPPPPPSILSLGYDKAIATGSMSKAFALAGLRIGWVAARDRAVVDALLAARDYTTISVSQLDDGVARYALSDAVRRPLLLRNVALAQTNAQHLAAFVRAWAARGRVRCTWMRPTAGTTAFVRFARVAAAAEAEAGPEPEQEPEAIPVDDEQFCLDVLAATKVMLVPGSRCFGHGRDFRGYVRIGYVCETDVLVEALARLDHYVAEHLAGDA
ncbi:aminotransferase, class i/classii [Niveomyces insectorum RCEF 264]|uniref:Aminotransferase, class i/classii n=1 Tax=Niveomyces insectorum RCEF 264 TaxID=1081102 RepID=A0A167N1Y8_9HYPO|nr:aminotransferase, class i/classii [Niveomyces insectorum RCEF 264]